MIDKVAWIELADGRVLSTRSKGKDTSYLPGVTVRMTCYTAQYSGTLAPASEIAEIVWLSATDTARIAPVDHLIFTHLQATGLLRP